MKMDVSKLGYAQLSGISGRRFPNYRFKCRGGQVTLEPDSTGEDSPFPDLSGLAADAELVAPITFL